MKRARKTGRKTAKAQRATNGKKTQKVRAYIRKRGR